MRRDGLLTSQRGSAPLDAVIGITFLVILCLGAIQVALTVYAHNAVSASAYEGARAAAEIGTSSTRGREVAERMVRATVGGSLENLQVSVWTTHSTQGPLVKVAVVGRHRSLGPMPIVVPVRAVATSILEVPPT